MVRAPTVSTENGLIFQKCRHDAEIFARQGANPVMLASQSL